MNRFANYCVSVYNSLLLFVEFLHIDECKAYAVGRIDAVNEVGGLTGVNDDHLYVQEQAYNRLHDPQIGVFDVGEHGQCLHHKTQQEGCAVEHDIVIIELLEGLIQIIEHNDQHSPCQEKTDGAEYARLIGHAFEYNGLFVGIFAPVDEGQQQKGEAEQKRADRREIDSHIEIGGGVNE